MKCSDLPLFCSSVFTVNKAEKIYIISQIINKTWQSIISLNILILSIAKLVKYKI